MKSLSFTTPPHERKTVKILLYDRLQNIIRSCRECLRDSHLLLYNDYNGKMRSDISRIWLNQLWSHNLVLCSGLSFITSEDFNRCIHIRHWNLSVEIEEVLCNFCFTLKILELFLLVLQLSGFLKVRLFLICSST